MKTLDKCGWSFSAGMIACVVTCMILEPSFVDSNPLQSKGYECTLSYEGLKCYFNGEEMTVKEWQTSMGFTGTKVDGAAGKTMNKALELNRLQKGIE